MNIYRPEFKCCINRKKKSYLKISLTLHNHDTSKLTKKYASISIPLIISYVYTLQWPSVHQIIYIHYTTKKYFSLDKFLQDLTTGIFSTKYVQLLTGTMSCVCVCEFLEKNGATKTKKWWGKRMKEHVGQKKNNKKYVTCGKLHFHIKYRLFLNKKKLELLQYQKTSVSQPKQDVLAFKYIIRYDIGCPNLTTNLRLRAQQLIINY